MDAVKFDGVDCIAVAPGCFDLPLMQCVDLCRQCNGKGKILYEAGRMRGDTIKCEACDGQGHVRVRLVTNWKFTPEEWQYMVDNPDARGVFLSVCTVQTPPVLVTMWNPVTMWPGEIVPLKKLMNDTQAG